MNVFRKIGRGVAVLAIAPLSGLEKKERDRRIAERIKHLEEKHRFT